MKMRKDESEKKKTSVHAQSAWWSWRKKSNKPTDEMNLQKVFLLQAVWAQPRKCISARYSLAYANHSHQHQYFTWKFEPHSTTNELLAVARKRRKVYPLVTIVRQFHFISARRRTSRRQHIDMRNTNYIFIDDLRNCLSTERCAACVLAVRQCGKTIWATGAKAPSKSNTVHILIWWLFQPFFRLSLSVLSHVWFRLLATAIKSHTHTCTEELLKPLHK